MNWIDLIIAVPLLIGIILGVVRGILKTIGTLVGLILAILLSYFFSESLSHPFADWFSLTPHQGYVLAFFVIFVLTLLICVTVAWLLEKLLKSITLGWVNRLFGGLFGLLKYALLLSVLINLVDAVDERFELIPREMKSESLLYKPVKAVVPTLMPYVHFYLDSENERTK